MIRLTTAESIGGIVQEPSVNADFEPGVNAPEELELRHPITNTVLYRANLARAARVNGVTGAVGEALTTTFQDLRLTRPIFQNGPITPATALELILNRTGVPFVNPIPAFALRGADGLIYPQLGALTINWDVNTEDAPTLRDVLEEFFAPFSGYAFRANADNRLEVIAPSWATLAAPLLSLTNADILDNGLATVEDRRDIVNLCVVRSKGWEFVAGQQVAQDAIAEFGYRGVNAGVSNDQNIGTVPENFRNAWLTSNAYAINDAVIFGGSRYRCKLAVAPGGADPTVAVANWEISRFDGRLDISNSSLVPLQTGVYTSGVLTVDIEMTLITGYRNFFGTWIVDNTVTTTTLSLSDDGEALNVVLTLDRGIFYSPRFVESVFRARRVAQGVEFTPYITLQSPVGAGGQLNWVGYRFRFIVTGNKWQEGKTTSTGRFGEDVDDTALLGLGASRAKYGVRSRSFDLGVYQLTADQCLQIARSYVTNNINADLVSTIDLCPPWRSVPGQLGREVSLPDGTIGTMESWSLTEAHSADSTRTAMQIVVRVEDRSSRALEGDTAYGSAAYGISRY